MRFLFRIAFIWPAVYLLIMVGLYGLMLGLLKVPWFSNWEMEAIFFLSKLVAALVVLFMAGFKVGKRLQVRRLYYPAIVGGILGILVISIDFLLYNLPALRYAIEEWARSPVYKTLGLIFFLGIYEAAAIAGYSFAGSGGSDSSKGTTNGICSEVNHSVSLVGGSQGKRPTSEKLYISFLKHGMRYSPVVLAVISGYYLFLVILPFFLLGVHRVPYWDVVGGKVDYIDQIGILPFFGFAIVALVRYFASVIWLLSAAEVIRSRKWWILVVLALAPLPILYFYEGPYADYLLNWTGPE